MRQRRAFRSMKSNRWECRLFIGGISPRNAASCCQPYRIKKCCGVAKKSTERPAGSGGFLWTEGNAMSRKGISSSLNQLAKRREVHGEGNEASLLLFTTGPASHTICAISFRQGEYKWQ